MEKFKGALLVGALRLFALLPWRAAGSMSGKHFERLIRTVSRERLGVFHMIQPMAVPTA